ncbi:MAG: TaqI-like C-terminal specificity domain-containing protein [Mucilaginibacter sp.]
MSAIEQQIKLKIQAVGLPLKEWDIDIYRGVLTGYNEAFIIDRKKKDQLINQDPKSAEIIRPILRGRDIKRYNYDFADLWLINVHNGIKESGIKPIDINDFPAIKSHLDQFYPELEKRLDKGVTPYNLRNCAYMDDFNRQKLIWIELADKGRFSFDYKDHYMTLNGTFIMLGEDLEYLCCILNNPVTSWHFNTFCISSGVGTNQWRELYVRELFIPKISDEEKTTISLLVRQIVDEKDEVETLQKQNKLNRLVYAIWNLNQEEIDFIESQ